MFQEISSMYTLHSGRKLLNTEKYFVKNGALVESLIRHSIIPLCQVSLDNLCRVESVDIIVTCLLSHYLCYQMKLLD